jgi:hypothetical protein
MYNKYWNNMKKILLIVLIVTVVLLVIPVTDMCGGRGSCASTPDENCNYHTYYEQKPLVAYLAEMVLTINIPIRYSTGTEVHHLDNCKTVSNQTKP